ncbi:MAG: PPC domain-containing protein [Chloroflexi bacterium]|nr:PPC domain-containing protein [Chloroflexota bacterium]
MRARFIRIAASISLFALLTSFAVATVSVATAAPVQPSRLEQSRPPRVDVFTEKIPFGETYVRQFDAAEGDQITITARAVDGDFDPRMTLRASDGTMLAANDNAAIPDPTLGARDARIEGVILPATGTYTIEVSGSQGIGGTMELSPHLVRGSDVHAAAAGGDCLPTARPDPVRTQRGGCLSV